MGDDDVVAGVSVVLRLVELELGVGEGRVASQWQELYAVVLLDGSEHLPGRLPMLGKQSLVVEMHNKLTCRLETGIGHGFRVVKDVPEFKFSLLRTCYQFDNSTGVKQ